MAKFGGCIWQNWRTWISCQ